jgi:isopentenyl-diphosphate delta-isomerase
MGEISQRKTDHLELSLHADVGFHRNTALFDCVTLEHDALPELDFNAIDLSCEVLGKRLRAPILIAAMTGGNERAGRINRELASIAEERGYAFGLGSQRPMLTDRETRGSYRVRDIAPTALVLGNIGAVQVRRMRCVEIENMVGEVEVDALCVHLNPAMELIQVEGDRDFRGNLDTLGELSARLKVPVVAKETGCGLSAHVARRLAQQGVWHVDVSGAGGTSWVAVEYHRAPPVQQLIAKTFWDWGIPTAASVALCAAERMKTIFATGGVTSGLDIARAIVLGATVAGIARPVLQALEAGGRAEAVAFLERLETELRMTMLLIGAADLTALAKTPCQIDEPLSRWIERGLHSRREK